jgi:hypothetical protein
MRRQLFPSAECRSSFELETHVMRFVKPCTLCIFLQSLGSVWAQTVFPGEPVKIGTAPQLLVDNFIVDNTWTVRYRDEHIDRVFHVPTKYADNPILKFRGGYVCVVRNEASGVFHMWYQTHVFGKEGERTKVAIAYATSSDGLEWTLPKLGLHEWQGTKENNIVITGRRIAAGVWLFDVPKKDKRGYKYILSYHDADGAHVAGSKDGIHFERHPLRPRLVDYGPGDSWEDEMVIASSWVEVGDEWWIYYAGWDGPHITRDRNSAVGLAKLRKEGFVSRPREDTPPVAKPNQPKRRRA